MNDVEKIIIIGGGCSGLTAAIYAARANLSPIVINGLQPGGQLTMTNEVENFPGFPNGINGFDLTYSMRQQAEKFGTHFIDDNVEGVDFSEDVKKIICKNGTYRAKAVIIATGASPKLLGINGEQEYYGGKGVSVCATCDGAFYKGKDVVVVGGGDTACEESRFLTKFCKKIYLIHRRDELRASQLMRDRVIKNEKISPVWNSIITEIVGENKVSGVIVENVINKEQKKISCEGVFLAIGNIPNTKQFANALKLDESGYIVRKNGSFVETEIDGIFVAGDCADKVYRQAITSAGTGAMAAISAERYICKFVGGK